MAVSKRLRYEVLRRDNHQCRYCGATAPDAALTVDHVIPTALGGSDEPGNLVTACMPCNSGKSASVPDAPLVRDVDEAALRWSRAMAVAAELAMADLDKRERAYDEFDEAWTTWTHGPQKVVVPRPSDWRRSVDTFIGVGLPMPILLDAVRRAMENRKVAVDQTWRYMCGIAWGKVNDLQATALNGLESPDGVSRITGVRPLVEFAKDVLDSDFDEQAEIFIYEAQAEEGDLPDGELHAAAVRVAIRNLREHDRRMTQTTRWAVELLGEDVVALRALAEAHCAELLGQYRDSDIDGCMIFLARHPDKRAIVEARMQSGGDA